MSDVPEESIDMAIIIVPPKIVASVIEEAAKCNVKGVVVITAGFKEVGGEGVELENGIKKISGQTRYPFGRSQLFRDY